MFLLYSIQVEHVCTRACSEGACSRRPTEEPRRELPVNDDEPYYFVAAAAAAVFDARST